MPAPVRVIAEASVAAVSSLTIHTVRGGVVLERLGFDGTSAGDAAREQVNVASFCYLLTLYLLEKNAPKFQSMEP